MYPVLHMSPKGELRSNCGDQRRVATMSTTGRAELRGGTETVRRTNPKGRPSYILQTSRTSMGPMSFRFSFYIPSFALPSSFLCFVFCVSSSSSCLS